MSVPHTEPAGGDHRPRILVIRPGALGDICRTLPALHAVRRWRPAARIAWLVYEPWFEFLNGHPEIDELIIAPRGAAGLALLMGTLRRRRFDITLDFQGTWRSGMLAMLSGCRQRYGFAHRFGREGNFLFHNHRVALAAPYLHRVDKNLALAAALGAPTDLDPPPWPVVDPAPPLVRDWLARQAPGDRPMVLLCPGTSRRQAYKRWPAVHFARLATLLDRAGVRAAIAWGPGEADLANRIESQSGGLAPALPPTRLRELAAFLGASACVVSGDTGPMHIAAAMGVPVVALFGGTDPRLNAPRGHRTVLLDGAPGPTGRRRRQRQAGRYLAAVMPEQTVAEILKLLRGNRTDARTLPVAG